MLRELLGIFRPSDPLRAMADNFGEMLKVTYQMILTAGEIFFDDDKVEEERARIYRQDTRVNALERTIRRQVVAHLFSAGKYGGPSVLPGVDQPRQGRGTNR